MPNQTHPPRPQAQAEKAERRRAIAAESTREAIARTRLRKMGDLIGQTEEEIAAWWRRRGR